MMAVAVEMCIRDSIRPSKNACQVIIGTKVQFVYDELKKML